jgi:hypothetical protein
VCDVCICNSCWWRHVALMPCVALHLHVGMTPCRYCGKRRRTAIQMNTTQPCSTVLSGLPIPMQGAFKSSNMRLQCQIMARS